MLENVTVVVQVYKLFCGVNILGLQNCEGKSSNLPQSFKVRRPGHYSHPYKISFRFPLSSLRHTIYSYL